MGLSNILTSASKKKNNTKKLKVGEVSELDSVTETVSSLVAFVNNTLETKFDNIKDMHEFYQQEATHTTVHKREAVLLSTILMTRNLTNQPPLVTVNQVATKNPWLKDVNNVRCIKLEIRGQCYFHLI